MLTIIPNDPSWSEDAMALATALVRGVDPTEDQATGLWFLLRQGEDAWASPDARRCIEWPEPDVAHINWQQLAFALRNLHLLSLNTRTAVRMACSFADARVLVPMADCLTLLTASNRELFATAWASAETRTIALTDASTPAGR